MNGLLNTVSAAALTESRTLFEVGLVVVLAAAAPLIGQVLRLPSILVLLGLGFGAGAVGALVDSVLKWEGTLADPIGATLGVVVFSAVVAGHAKAGQEIFQFLLNVGVGVGFGVAGAALILAWATWFKPNQSQAMTGTLMFVVAAVVGADLLRDDSGLITGLVIGAILVNRPPRGTEPHGSGDPASKARSGRGENGSARSRRS